MNDALFKHWVQNHSGLSPSGVDTCRRAFENVPGIDGILAQAIRGKLDLAGIRPLVMRTPTAPPVAVVKAAPLPSAGSGQSQGLISNAPIPPSNPIPKVRTYTGFGKFLKSVGEAIKNANDKRKAKAAQTATTNQPAAPKKPLNKKMLIYVGVGVVVLVVAVAAFMLLPGGTSAPPVVAPTPTAPNPEAPPVLNAVPIDLQSSDWFKPIQILILVEVFGMLFALGMDAKIRKQWFDAVIPFVATILVIFVAGGAAFGSWGILAVAVVAVTIAFFNGGKDFSPIGTFLTLIGAAGGLIFNKIAAIQAAFGIQATPVLPIGQMMILFQLKAWSQLYFPLVVYVALILGLIFSVLEAIRPSGDKNPRWGTVVGGVVGIAAFYLLFHLVPAIPAFACYLVGFALAIGISAASQNERVMRLVTDKWGIRTMFDSAMLMTSVLLVVQLCTGIPGLFVR